MKKIYANIDSVESMNYLKKYENEINEILYSEETKKNLTNFPEVAQWVNNYPTNIGSLGSNIICGVIK